MILSVGYRTNSARAIEFRQWATKTLRSHIVDGYTINKSRIKQNYEAFLQSVADVQAAVGVSKKAALYSIRLALLLN
jgi:hypothetical protein